MATQQEIMALLQHIPSFSRLFEKLTLVYWNFSDE